MWCKRSALPDSHKGHFFCFILALVSFPDSVGAAAGPRGDVKTAGRRTSAPPAVSTQGHQQRALLREKSKENQLDRNGCQLLDRDSDKSGFDIGLYDAMKMFLVFFVKKKLHTF